MVNGFKKTEAGIIPKDWEVTAIGEVSSPKARIGWQNMRKSEFLDSGSFMLITGTDFDGGRINYATCKYVSEERYNQDPNIQVGNGDILITKDGTLGKVALIRELSMKATLNAGVFVLRNLSPTVNNEFLYQYLSTNKLMDYARRTSTGGTIQHLNQKVLVNFPIPVPPLSEQRRIAKALGNMDELIAQSELEVHKWQAVKQGCLQRMFPQKGQSEPEMRFPGFTGAWVKRQLGEVFNTLPNNTLSRAELNDESGTTLDIHYGDVLVRFGDCVDVSHEHLPFINDDAVAAKFAGSLLKNGDVVMADTAEDETVGKCTEITGQTVERVVPGLHIIPLHPGEQFARGYLGAYLNSDSYHNQLKPLMQGIKVTSISKSAVMGTFVRYPPDFFEQRETGEFFAELDRLIATRQRQVKKYQMIKQGMMEELLSGHTRLTEGDDAQ